MSAFNPEAFMSGETEGAMETHYTPIPEGDYPAFIQDVKPKEVNDTPVLDVLFKVTDDKLAKDMDMEDVIVKASIFCDVDGKGNLQFGANKNVKLGKLREACGQNNAAKAWAPLMLVGGGPLIIRVTQRPDKNDSETIYNDVSRYTAA